MVELLRLEAFGKVKSGAKLEEQLKALSSKVQAPEMPKTAAVLQTIPALSTLEPFTALLVTGLLLIYCLSQDLV